MSDEEKKFKLDELPDQGSEPESPKPRPKPKANKPEPRIEKIKSLDDQERIKVLTERWHFDVRKKKWGWLVFLLVLLFLEKGKKLDSYEEDRKRLYKQTDGLSEIMFTGDITDIFLRHPLFFAILIPLFFKFSESSDVFFEINFEGISTVRNILVPSGHGVVRVKIRWNEIKAVSTGKAGKRDILILADENGPIGELIWDIEELRKKVVKQVVRGLVNEKHPLRQFLEKEVA